VYDELANKGRKILAHLNVSLLVAQTKFNPSKREIRLLRE